MARFIMSDIIAIADSIRFWFALSICCHPAIPICRGLWEVSSMSSNCFYGAHSLNWFSLARATRKTISKYPRALHRHGAYGNPPDRWIFIDFEHVLVDHMINQYPWCASVQQATPPQSRDLRTIYAHHVSHRFFYVHLACSHQTPCCWYQHLYSGCHSSAHSKWACPTATPTPS